MNTPDELNPEWLSAWTDSEDVSVDAARVGKTALPHLVGEIIRGGEDGEILGRWIAYLCFGPDAVPLRVCADSIPNLSWDNRAYLMGVITGFGTQDFCVTPSVIQEEFEKQGGAHVWQHLLGLTENTQNAALERLVSFVRAAHRDSEAARTLRSIFTSVCSEGVQVELRRMAYLDEAKIHDVLAVLTGLYEGGEIYVDHIIMAFEDAGVPLAIPGEELDTE